MRTVSSAVLAPRRVHLLVLPCVLLLAGGRLPPHRPDPGPTALEQLPAAARLHDGDLVFRRGRSLLSRVVLSSDAAASFSHVGMIRHGRSGLEVIHAVPPDDRGPGGLVVDPVERFLAPETAEGAAVYTPRRAGAGRAALAQAERLLADNPPFDGDFDLTTESSLYCTELVWLAYRRAGLDLVDGRLDHLDIPLGGGPYLLISRLQQSRHLELVPIQVKGDPDAPP